ncbi:MAG TPA: glycosyltransferase family 39 protein [Gaiellaceae bacterium]|nr:glycosyltransferase family 39 protein [Gaiellaceae bacterium]
MRFRERARPLGSLIAGRQPWSVLGPLLVLQWLCLLVFALSAEHNGWLYYQGGDQSYYWTGAHLLSQWTLPVTLVGYSWSYLLIPVAFFAGSNVLAGLPVVIVLNALILLPVALLCVYGIATRIAGRVFGYWAAALWIVIPYVTIPMFDHRYHEKYVDITLPQSLGLTVLGDFPSTVFLLVTAWLLVRALDTHDWADAVLAGLVGGFVIGLKPSNALFFGAAVLCLVVARRWTQTAVFLGALVPGLAILALWKQRGLGELPAFSSAGAPGDGSLAAVGGAPLGSLLSPVRRYVDLDWHHLHQNIDGVREFFWAVRPLEFVPLAGLLAIGRRSWPKAILVFGWFITFLLIKGTDEKANIEDASFFRLLMPSFPAFLLLLAAIPLLVPASGWTRHALPVPLPAIRSRRPGRRVLAAAAVVLVVLPLVVVAGTGPQSSAEAVIYRFQDVYVPVRSFGLEVRRSGGRQELTWNAPYTGRTRVFYTILRARPEAPDPTNDERTVREGIACRDREHGASLRCDVVMNHLSTTSDRRYVDRPPPGRWTYRVGLSANWVDDTTLGDVILVSEPVTVTVS